LSSLEEVRRLIFAKEFRAAAALAEQDLMGEPKSQAPYQPLGDLFIEFAGHESYADYRRELDLDRAVVRIDYRVGRIEFSREVFISAADQVLVARFVASEPGALSSVFRLASAQRG